MTAMENLIELKNDYNSLDKLKDFLEKESVYECSKTYDAWEVRTGINGQMEECIILKKSSMHAYFGKSVKARKSIV